VVPMYPMLRNRTSSGASGRDPCPNTLNVNRQTTAAIVATGNVRSIAFIVVSGGRPARTLAAFLIGYQLNRGYRTARQNFSKRN
jgi:hypothetical protein